MRYASIYSGVGAMDLGLCRAGMTCVYQHETNSDCLRLLEHYWPDVRRGSSASPHEELGRTELPAVDMVCGSVQFSKNWWDPDVSWSDFAAAVRLLQPRWVVVETRGRAVSKPDIRGARGILGLFAELGLDAVWSPVSTCHFGAPHLHSRMYFVAHPVGVSLLGGNPLERCHAIPRPYERRSLWVGRLRSSLDPEPTDSRGDARIPAGLAVALANSGSPIVWQWLGTMIRQCEQKRLLQGETA